MRGTKSPGLTDFHPYMRVSAVFPSVIQQIERFQPRCDLFCNSLMDRRWNLERIQSLPASCSGECCQGIDDGQCHHECMWLCQALCKGCDGLAVSKLSQSLADGAEHSDVGFFEQTCHQDGERMLISALPKQHGCHFPRLCNRMVERPHQFLIVENRLDLSKRCATSMVQSQMTNSA